MRKIHLSDTLHPTDSKSRMRPFLGNKPKGYAIPEAFEDYVKLLASQSLNSCMSTDAFYLTDDVHLLTIPFLLPTWRMQTKMTTSAISTHSKADRFTRRGQMTTCGMPLMSVFTHSTLLSTTCFPLPMPPMQKNIACAPKRSTSVLSNTWHWSTSTPAIITKKRQQPIMAFL